MATLYITEYENIGKSLAYHLMQVPLEPPSASQTVTPDANGELSSTFTAKTAYVRLCADVDILVGFGAAPILADAGAYLTAGTVEYFAVPPGFKLIVATV